MHASNETAHFFDIFSDNQDTNNSSQNQRNNINSYHNTLLNDPNTNQSKLARVLQASLYDGQKRNMWGNSYADKLHDIYDYRTEEEIDHALRVLVLQEMTETNHAAPFHEFNGELQAWHNGRNLRRDLYLKNRFYTHGPLDYLFPSQQSIFRIIKSNPCVSDWEVERYINEEHNFVGTKKTTDTTDNHNTQHSWNPQPPKVPADENLNKQRIDQLVREKRTALETEKQKKFFKSSNEIEVQDVLDAIEQSFERIKTGLYQQKFTKQELDNDIAEFTESNHYAQKQLWQNRASFTLKSAIAASLMAGIYFIASIPHMLLTQSIEKVIAEHPDLVDKFKEERDIPSYLALMEACLQATNNKYPRNTIKPVLIKLLSQ